MDKRGTAGPIGTVALDLDLAGVGQARQAVAAALRKAAMAWPKPCRIRVRRVLIYEEPLRGTWWWNVTVTAAGSVSGLLVDPRHQTPAFVVDFVERALAGKAFRLVCAWCGKVRLSNGSWRRLKSIKDPAELSHGICPSCVVKHYPGLRPSRGGVGR